MKKITVLIIACSLGGVFVSCSSAPQVPVAKAAPAQAPVATVTLPDWVVHTPKTEDDDYVFVASGTDPTGDLGAAEKAAAQDLKDQVTTYLGVKVTTTTNAKAKGSLDSYQANVEQSVVSQSKAQVSGLRVSERFPVQTGASLTLYIKALYKQSELDREKARIAALFIEVQDAVAKPEAEGDRLAAQGNYMDAVSQYVLAASAATGPEIENASIKMDRNLGKAQTILSKVRLISQTPPQKTTLGVPFGQTFDVLVVYGSQENPTPLAGVNLRFNYKTRKSGRVLMAGAAVKTDEKGLASFTFPTPDFAARDNLIVVLDVNPFLERLALLPKAQQNKVSAIEDVSAQSRLTLPYTIESAAKETPLALALLDLDDAANPLKKPESANAVQEVLTKAGFTLSPIPGFDPAKLRNLDDGAALGALRPLVDKSIPRVAFGTLSVSEVSQDGKVFTARAVGTIKVFDLASGKLLYVLTKSRRSIGGDKTTAVAASLRELGTDLGTTLVDELP